MAKIKDRKTKHPGVRIRGNSILIDFRYKKVRCRETLRMEPSATNLKHASNMRGTILRDIAIGKFNYADYFPKSRTANIFGGGPSSNMTVGECMDWWFDNFIDNPLGTTEIGHKGIIKNHIKPGIGNIFINDLTPRQVRAWLDNIKLSPSTKNNILSPVRSALEAAYNEKSLTSILHDKLPDYERDRPKKEAYTINEVDRLLEELEEEFSLFYQFKFFTGLSTGEQLGLQWGDVDFEECRLSISRQLAGGVRLKGPKNGYRVRTIDILNPAYDALMALKPDDYDDDPAKYSDSWVFINPKSGKTWRIDDITKPLREACNKLNIAYKKGYKTRHTFASIMVTCCLPDAWIREQMGHATMDMLSKTYAKVYSNSHEVLEWLRKKTQNGHNGKMFCEFFF